MPQCGYVPAGLATFCRLDGLGLVVAGRRLSRERATLLCRPVESDDWRHRCGCHGQPRGSVTCELARVPSGWRSTILHVRLRRCLCTGCGRVWRQDFTSAAQPRSCLSDGVLRWALEALVVNRLSMSRIAATLGVAWHTANDAVLAEGQRLLTDQPGRLDDVAGRRRRQTRKDDKYVTVVIDLAPVSTGPSRLLAMTEK